MVFRKLEQSFCVLEYARNSSVVNVQRRFRAEFQKAAPVFNSIKKWYAKFQDEGCLCIAPRPGRPEPSEETVNRIKETYQRSPCKSTIRKKNLESFSVYRRKNYHDPLRSLFVANF